MLFPFLVLPLVTYLAKATPSFDGTYTVVNKANGWRMFASPNTGLFVVEDGGPIYSDQMWLFSPQENGSFAIINAGNGLRVLAQSPGQGEHGFFAIDHGPIYQDQKWHLTPQEDGSYTMVNVKSKRKIFANVGNAGKVRFAASMEDGVVTPEQTWWVINQERDDTSTYVGQLLDAKKRLTELSLEISDVRVDNQQLMERLQSTLQQQKNLASQNEMVKLELSDALLDAGNERSLKEKLSAELELHRSRHTQLQHELAKEKQEKEALLAESAKAADLADSNQKKLLKAALLKYRDATDMLQDNITRLNNDLMVSHGLNLELASTVKALEGRLAQGIPSTTSYLSKVFGTVAAVSCAIVLMCVGHWYSALVVENRRKNQQISDLEDEIQAEIGDMVCVGDCDGGLKHEFGFSIFDSEMNQETVRVINIQCPGVKHADVEVDLVFNGCTVTICRQESRALPSSRWTRRFQFKPSDGLFEFREEQMILEDGILQLVFRANAFQSRRVLFARHFNLTETDADACWDFSAEAEHSDEADAWWHDGADFSKNGADRSVDKNAKWQDSSIDIDTESTASTIREIV